MENTNYYIFRDSHEQISYVKSKNLESSPDKREFWDVKEILFIAVTNNDMNYCEMEIKNLVDIIEKNKGKIPDPEELNKRLKDFKIGRSHSHNAYWPFSEVYVNISPDAEKEKIVPIQMIAESQKEKTIEQIAETPCKPKEVRNKPSLSEGYILYRRAGGFFSFAYIWGKEDETTEKKKKYIALNPFEDADSEAEDKLQSLVETINGNISRARRNRLKYHPEDDMVKWIDTLKENSKEQDKKFWPFKSIELLW